MSLSKEGTISKVADRKMKIDFTNNKAKIKLKIGYIEIFLENKFNYIQRKLWKKLLGIEIEVLNGK